jgi:hypothetical protein
MREKYIFNPNQKTGGSIKEEEEENRKVNFFFELNRFFLIRFLKRGKRTNV